MKNSSSQKKKRYLVYFRNIYEILYNNLLTEKSLLPSIESSLVTGHFLSLYSIGGDGSLADTVTLPSKIVIRLLTDN